jgi:peptidoglycan/xylan/chitin deacetylase (PgdA/CDA1 family)
MSGQTNGRRLAILGYHKVGPAPGGWETWFRISEAAFVSHLTHLRDAGWQVISLDAFLHGLKVPDSLPYQAALLTFDDGYRSVLDVVLPCLLQFGYPAVLFVPTDFIGKFNTFDTDIEPEEAICDWADLRMLEPSGIAVQSHGASHQGLSRLPPAAQEEELVRSKAELEAGLGRPVEVFSYPYGDGGAEWVRTAMERCGYRAGCLYGGSINRVPIADAFRVQRLAIGADTDLSAALK